MTYKYSQNRKVSRSKLPKHKIIVFLLLTTLAMLTIWFFISRNKAHAPQNSAQTEQSQEKDNKKSTYKTVNLQPTIDQWINKYPGEYSIVVYDLQTGETIGQNQKDQKIFAASLYKIYVAYLSLLDFQTGAQNPDEIIIAGQTKKQCVDKMIRSSDSPCGEAMMANIGQLVLNQRVADMGMTGTSFNGIQTTASDSALILKYINDNRDLNTENTEFLLDAMLTQDAKFKRGLQAGAPEAKWQTKVGWNEDENYHDIGIMTLPDKRKFAVAVLSQGNGSPEPIANLAKTIYSTLTTQ